MTNETKETLLRLTRKTFGHVKNSYANAQFNQDISGRHARQACETLGRMESILKFAVKETN